MSKRKFVGYSSSSLEARAKEAMKPVIAGSVKIFTREEIEALEREKGIRTIDHRVVRIVDTKIV